MIPGAWAAGAGIPPRHQQWRLITSVSQCIAERRIGRRGDEPAANWYWKGRGFSADVMVAMGRTGHWDRKTDRRGWRGVQGKKKKRRREDEREEVRARWRPPSEYRAGEGICWWWWWSVVSGLIGFSDNTPKKPPHCRHSAAVVGRHRGPQRPKTVRLSAQPDVHPTARYRTLPHVTGSIAFGRAAGALRR